jgi:hypothetical protein
MKIVSFLIRGTDLFEKTMAIGIICILFITAIPTYSKIIESTTSTKLLSVKTNISYAIELNSLVPVGGRKIKYKYGYPTARSITNIVDLSDFDVSVNIHYIDIRVNEDDKLLLRYFPCEDGPCLKIIKVSLIKEYST